MRQRLSGWWESIAVYRHRRVAAMLFLGFSAGLPFPLVFSTLSAWLRDYGVDRATIGFFVEVVDKVFQLIQDRGNRICLVSQRDAMHGDRRFSHWTSGPPIHLFKDF